MGTRMAARLLERGHDVIAWDRDPVKVGRLTDLGARAAATPATAATAPLVITMLSDFAAVREVALGPGGLRTGPLTALAQMSTLAPAQTRQLHEQLGTGIGLLDLPVAGSVDAAAKGTLRLFAGGDPGLLEQCRPVLGELGQLVHVGDVGAGSALKLVLNAAVAPMVALLAEALLLADRNGLDEVFVLDELSRSRIGPLVDRKREKLLTRRFDPDSKLRLFAKDMDLVVSAGDASGVDMSLASAALRLARAAEAAGLGESDYSVLAHHLRASREIEPG